MTLNDVLAAAGRRALGGWTFHDGREVVALPARELYLRASELAFALRGAGVGSGRTVGVVGPNRPEWACWAWAVWLSGAALVPLPAPVITGPSFASQIKSLLSASGCSVVVGERRYLDLLGDVHIEVWDWSAQLPCRKGGRASEVAPSPSDLAVVLCTSGSTSAPKAVRMSHARAVEWATHNALRTADGSVPSMVTWFPFHHIAGLGTLFEVVTPVDQHVISMRRFLADPSSWIRLVSDTRSRYAVSPSSVWSEVLDGIERDPGGIDLSCLDQVAFNAEMVDPEVLARLAGAGRRLGLRDGAVAVHYASSEAGMISQTPPGTEPRVEAVDQAELATSGRAVPAGSGVPAKRVVSCGVPYPGAEVCVGHPSGPLRERQEGEVWVRGPGVADGYLNVSDQGRIVEGWLWVGDLGYLADGELWITGRADEVVISHGEKYHPEDIEWAVRQAIGGAPGSCAAFSAGSGASSRFVVVVETESPSTALAGAVGSAASEAVGAPPSEVVLVGRGTIPVTPNGKLQRSALRERYSRGELPRI